jgi:hypothetical protein
VCAHHDTHHHPQKQISKLYKDHYRRTIGTRQLKTYLETLEDLEFLEVDVDPDDKRKHIYTVYREEV